MNGGSPEWASPELGTWRLVESAARFVSDHARWNLWATLTYREPVTHTRCMRAARTWLRNCARVCVRDHVPYFLGMGEQRRGAPHAHVLLAVPEERLAGLTVALDTSWRHADPLAGHALVERATPEHARNAAHYTVRGHDQWEINVACHRPRACRRSNGCIRAPGSW